jgi:hypothetical protein
MLRTSPVLCECGIKVSEDLLLALISTHPDDKLTLVWVHSRIEALHSTQVITTGLRDKACSVAGAFDEIHLSIRHVGVVTASTKAIEPSICPSVPVVPSTIIEEILHWSSSRRQVLSLVCQGQVVENVRCRLIGRGRSRGT